jgi:dipeptidyl aminopeptidase/acylaminoacyl peptidase
MLHATRVLSRRIAIRVLSLALVPALSLTAQAPRVMQYEDFAALKGISDPQVSPDGAAVLYGVRTTDLDANRRTTRTFRIATSGGTPTAWPDDSTRVTEARWSPDGRRVAYTSGGQLWVANADGTARRRLTSLDGGATGPVWSPGGEHIAFTSSVYPSCRTDACNVAAAKAAEDNTVKARITDGLMYRHWDSWRDGTRSHLFIASVDGAEPRDLIPGADYDVPLPPFGGSEGYAFAPDGREVAFTAKNAGREQAWSTNVNVFTVAISGGEPQVVTAANLGADQNPVYSPDGRWLYYASQARAGFEADRWRLMALDRRSGVARELLTGWDRNAESYFVAPDGRTLYVGTGDRGRDRLFAVALTADGSAAGAPAPLVTEHNNLAFSLSRDGRTLVWLRDAAHHPATVFVRSLAPVAPPRVRVRQRGAAAPVVADRQLTHENDAALAQLSLAAAEDFWFAGAKNDSIHGFLVKPPQWRAGEKYPVVLLIHGGPQGAWLDSWSSRWNYQLFAAMGAAVVAINPRGSTGYGQRITDEVSRDWGGKVYEDLMKGLDFSLARYHWMDSTRLSAAGGSFGGYMVNWMLGHTDRFKAFVSHAGVFNLENMYGATEEVWFADWEYGGPYWNEQAMKEQYRVFSPHLFAKNFRTPTLVLHGELDYRVPYYEGISLFTALQRQNVPSRMVVYPDEGHWILKPQNHRLWMREVEGWIRKYTAGRTTS